MYRLTCDLESGVASALSGQQVGEKCVSRYRNAFAIGSLPL